MLYGFYHRKELKKLKESELNLFVIFEKPTLEVLRLIPKKTDGGTSFIVEQ